MVWLSIDAGTSVIKAVLLDASGRQLAAARESVVVSRAHPGHAEQNMDEVWQAVVDAGRAALCNNLEPVAGIACTAQGDGVWLVDADGNSVAPAILWNDGRAQEVVERWRRQGIVERAFRISGSVPYAGLPSAIFPWLAAHQPEKLERARWSLTCNGWLHLRLTGQVAADLSDASNPFSDVVKRQYEPQLLELYGAAAYERLLPPIHPGFAPVSRLRDEAAKQLGLPSGLPVVMAPYDIVSTAAGCGSVLPGEGCLILGTTICAEVVAEDPGLNRTPAGTTIALADGSFLRAMPTLTGCEALDWATSLLQTEDLDTLSALAAHSPVGSGNLVFLPYLSPAGERAPFLAPEAKGSFLGLSLSHTREHLSRAVFEGLSFAIRECLLAASPARLSRITVCGGGSRSDLWRQIIADVCGCEVVRPSTIEAGAQGAFFYAQVATGAVASLKQAAACSTAHCFPPSPQNHERYDELYRRFLRLRDTVAKTWEIMHPHGHHPGEEPLS